MTDDDNYEEALDFFVNFEGVSKRALNLIPRNTLVAMKRKIDNEYMKVEDVNEKYTLNENVPEVEPPLEESELVSCEGCGADNFDFMYDHNKNKKKIQHCIYCGALLHPPHETIIKKYIQKPRKNHKAKKYNRRDR